MNRSIGMMANLEHLLAEYRARLQEATALRGEPAALLLRLVYNIEGALTISDLQSTRCYNGTNVTYNVGKLVDGGYVVLGANPRDGRVKLVEVTERGRDLAASIKAQHDVFVRRHGARLRKLLVE